MSTEKFLRAFGNIKDEYIIEATCIGEAAAVNGAPKPENAKKAALNKKIKILLPIAACLCLIAAGIIGCYSLFFAPSNGEKPNESKYKDTDLYEVFAEASSMSESPFSGVTRKWSILPERIADESVPKEIDYEIDGETVHLILDYSVRTGWSKQKDNYQSENKTWFVSFDHATGRMVAFGRKQDYPDTGDELSDEELMTVAENLVLEKWPMLKDNFNIVGLTKYNTSNKVAIYVHQTVNGRGTNNAVDLYLTKQGNTIEWIERMVYPEGIPDNIQEAIAKTDIDLCKASIEKYISDLAKEHPEIKLIKVYGEEKCEFQFHYEDKRLLCMLPADVTVGNYDETVSFYVNIPY